MHGILNQDVTDFILDAHDGEEITCIAIDRLCRKLTTAARYGLVKVGFSFSCILFFHCFFY